MEALMLWIRAAQRMQMDQFLAMKMQAKNLKKKMSLLMTRQNARLRDGIGAVKHGLLQWMDSAVQVVAG
jgi:hypothetical protein